MKGAVFLALFTSTSFSKRLECSQRTNLHQCHLQTPFPSPRRTGNEFKSNLYQTLQQQFCHICNHLAPSRPHKTSSQPIPLLADPRHTKTPKGNAEPVNDDCKTPRTERRAKGRWRRVDIIWEADGRSICLVVGGK